MLAETIAAYQGLGNWSPHVEITRPAFESTVDIFLHAGLIASDTPMRTPWRSRRRASEGAVRLAGSFSRGAVHAGERKVNIVEAGDGVLRMRAGEVPARLMGRRR